MVDSVGFSGGGSFGGGGGLDAGGLGSIGSSGTAAFDLGGIGPNGGGPAPTGTGDLGSAGLSPIGSSGLSAFDIGGIAPGGGDSEGAKLAHYNDLVQQNADRLAATAAENRALIGTPQAPDFSPPSLSPPSFTPPAPSFATQPLDPFAAPRPGFPTFTLPPPAAGGALPGASAPFPPPLAPADTGGNFLALTPDALAAPDLPAPFDAGGFGLDPIGVPERAAFGPSGPALATPDTGLPLPADAGAPGVQATPAPVDPFAPAAAGGLGLDSVGVPGLIAFDAVPPASAPGPGETPAGGDPAAEQPGYVDRVFDRAADNFGTAFATPVGPGSEYRDFVDRYTAPTGVALIDSVSQPIFQSVLFGVPTLLDGAARGLGALYNTAVDTGTEGLVSAGMSASEAGRLGRDLKAFPEAFAGSPGAVMRPGVGALPGAAAAENAVPTVTANRIAGNAFRDTIADALRAAGRDVTTEVYKPTLFGKRFIDIEVSHNGQVLGGIETKVGDSRYTPAQQSKDMWLRLNNGYIVNVVRDR